MVLEQAIAFWRNSLSGVVCCWRAKGTAAAKAWVQQPDSAAQLVCGASIQS
jgi:hypothetical protein